MHSHQDFGPRVSCKACVLLALLGLSEKEVPIFAFQASDAKCLQQGT